VRKVDSDYYTDAMTYTNVRVIDSFENHHDPGAIVEHGEVQVVRKVVGYKKIKFYTSENLGYGDVNLPEKICTQPVTGLPFHAIFSVSLTLHRKKLLMAFRVWLYSTSFIRNVFDGGCARH